MSIERLQKATVAGVVAQREEILAALQDFGGLHLVDLMTHLPREDDAPNRSAVACHDALRYLETCPQRRKQVLEQPDFDPQRIADQALAVRDEIRRLRDRHDFLGKRIDDLRPWGNFQLPDDTLYGQRLWFYLLPNFQTDALDALELPWACVHRDNRFSYIALISEHEPDPKLLPVKRTHTGSEPLEALQREAHQLELRLEDLEAERQSLTRWIWLMHHSLATVDNQAGRRLAEQMALQNDQVFALQGWIAESRMDELSAVAEQHSLALVFERPSDKEQPPTLLSNPEQLAGGEEIVRFYQMPGYYGWDPSRVVFFSFALFFALILSDAGYAALLGLLLGVYWKKLGRSTTGRRMRALGTALTGTSLTYGMLVGSYFGAQAPWAPLAALQVLDINNFDQMMRLSVVIGTLHIILANLISAWQWRHRLRALASLGWVWLLIGGLSYWLANTTLLSLLLGIMGLGSILLFSSQRGWHGMDLLRRLLDGLLALTGVSKVFGDVLSYLRLFALGLASASLALTFNQLATDVAAAGTGLGFLLQILILILGHLINFVLSVVSGVIHGLRLNLLEFFNWSLSDEGYPFKPFANKEVQSWTI